MHFQYTILLSQCGCPFMARFNFHYDWYIFYWYPFVHCRPHSSSSRGRQVCEPQIHKYYSSTKKSNKQIHKNTQKPLKIQFQVFLYLTSRDVIGRRALPAWDTHPTRNRILKKTELIFMCCLKHEKALNHVLTLFCNNFFDSDSEIDENAWETCTAYGHLCEKIERHLYQRRAHSSSQVLSKCR